MLSLNILLFLCLGDPLTPIPGFTAGYLFSINFSFMTKVKGRLEAQCSELEESLEAEKLAKANLDRQKKKLEGELKASQASVEEGQAAHAAVAEALRKKEAENIDLSATVEDKDTQLAAAAKKIKDLGEKLSERESEAESLHFAKAKVFCVSSLFCFCLFFALIP